MPRLCYRAAETQGELQLLEREAVTDETALNLLAEPVTLAGFNEYKGEHLRGVPKEIEKGQIGRVWAEHSGGRCVFAMLFKLENGLSVTQQVDATVRFSAAPAPPR